VQASETIFALIDAEAAASTAVAAGACVEPPPKCRITFDNVTFAYPSRPEPAAVQRVSLVLEPGTVTAVVGPSGSGKSTLAMLLARLYPANSCVSGGGGGSRGSDGSSKESSGGSGGPGSGVNGSSSGSGSTDCSTGGIRFGGVPISDISESWLRHNVGVVPQQPVLFTGTIRENILFGVGDRSQETKHAIDSAVEQAARSANAHEFVVNKLGGYDQEVGELGVQMSGGQRQRLAIVRGHAWASFASHALPVLLARHKPPPPQQQVSLPPCNRFRPPCNRF
jgi:ATP-binding cassette subfamily B protein